MPKKEAVEQMFDSIAPEYDKLNHLLSLDIDRIWRRIAVRKALPETGPAKVLDIACGTGDFSIALARYNAQAEVTGVDISEGMLKSGREKVSAAHLEDRVKLTVGDCEALVHPDDSFDAVCVGFGVRNFEHRDKCLKEMLRVLKPGGRLVILELSVPRTPVIRNLYGLYFTKIIPDVGARVSGNRAAYRYLPASVLNFPMPAEFKAELSSCGFSSVSHRALTFGICRMYTAVK
ncbi:MAG: bifunctional demethylmenaquinone methyltransferase/2-methoxy-6-polyprenyl-1,4-benzoquinol methylase UbiE [Candidatus Cryptobacteroides sp.]